MIKGKKIASVFMAVMLIIMLSIPAVSAEDTLPKDAELAKDLGIIKGDGNGVTDEYLAKNAQRIQGAIMLLRLLGKEDQAKAFTGTDNFKDSDKVSWSEGENILAYLKAHPEYGFVGYSDGNFGVEDKILSQQFYKVLLTVMGYQAGDGKDFKYADTLKFAESKGLKQVATLQELTNNDMAIATVEALKAKLKGSDRTLADVLVSTGADRTKFEDVGLVQPPPPPPAPPAPVYIPAPPAPPSDTTPPTVVTPCTSATITAGEHISVVFSEHIGNKEDVQNSILGGTSGFDGPFQFNWNDTNNTLTVTNGSDTTATFAQDVTVDLTDLVGNITTNAKIIDITPPTVVTPCSSATITTGEHILIVFSECISNKVDVQNSILGGASGFDGPFQFNWNDTNNTLTVTNGSDATATFAQDVTVDLTDLAGNIATNAIIIDIP